MPDCAAITPLLTPYVDGELSILEREVCERHLSACHACQSRVASERSVRLAIASNLDSLRMTRAPESLRARCATLAAESGLRGGAERARPVGSGWRARLASLSVAASLVILVGAAFLYQFTAHSSRVLAAELAADHLKCFALNALLGTLQSPSVVEQAMASGFGWQMHLPNRPEEIGLELLGSRPCLYGEGRTAHVMFRHHGEPLSLFMLPNRRRTDEVIEVLGHEAVVWSVADRTFVLVSHESRANVERLASFMQSSIH